MINGNTDVEILLTLNSLVGNNALFNKFLIGIFSNPLIRGFPIFFYLAVLWFSADCTKRRSRMLVGLLATCIATILSVWLQYHITPHIRPLIDPALHIKILDPQWASWDRWDRQGSFPSDTATLYFSLTAIIFLENRLVGCLCFLWAFAIVGIPRVALGFHTPSDIVGSMVLGPGSVYLFNKIRYLGTLMERALKLFEYRMYIVHALLLVFLADAYNSLAGLQGLVALGRLVLGPVGAK
jgi:membrane-associated phospholipid phosphatase